MRYESNFELDGVLFGDKPLLLTGWDKSASAVSAGDVACGGRLVAGYEEIGAAVWTFHLATTATKGSLAAAFADLQVLGEKWRSPGESVLRHKIGDKWYRIYGRVRDFGGHVGNPIYAHGIIETSCVFVQLDPVFYGNEQTVDVGLVPSEVGGIMPGDAPPWVWATSSAELSRVLRVGGNVAAPVSVTFFGPVNNPKVTVGGCVIELVGGLAYDVSVTVDSRARTCLYGGARSGSAAGLLAPKVRLADMRVPANRNHNVVFGGIDPTGTARCRVSVTDSFVGI